MSTAHRHFHAERLNPHLTLYTNLYITDVNYRIRELVTFQVRFFKTECVIFSLEVLAQAQRLQGAIQLVSVGLCYG